MGPPAQMYALCRHWLGERHIHLHLTACVWKHLLSLLLRCQQAGPRPWTHLLYCTNALVWFAFYLSVGDGEASSSSSSCRRSLELHGLQWPPQQGQHGGGDVTRRQPCLLDLVLRCAMVDVPVRQEHGSQLQIN